MRSLFLARAKEALEHLDAETIVTTYDDPFVFEDIPFGNSAFCVAGALYVASLCKCIEAERLIRQAAKEDNNGG